MKLRLINSEPLPGDFNMSCDYSLASALKSGEDAILRLYTWIRPTISIGYHQKSDDIDVLKCREAGIDAVKRPTGGRAILHDGEITYCFIIPADAREKRRSMREIYRKVHMGISNAVSRYGLGVDLSPGRKTAERHHPICFASSASSELALDGRKVVGSAQRLLDSTVLQHGSILLTASHLGLPDYLNLDGEKRKRLRISLEESSTHIPLEDKPELRQVIADCIAKVFGLKLYNSKINKIEIKQINSNLDRFKIFHSMEE